MLENKIVYNGVEYPFIQFSSQDTADYKALRDMYYGIGGFKNGSYLEQFPRESDTFFTSRKALAHYENAFRPELDSSVDPIYSKEQIRSVEGSQIVENFVMKPTGLNFSMSEYKRRHQIDTKLYGTTWEICDAPREIPANASVENDERYSPYSYVLTPLQVYGYTLNDKGSLEMLVYYEDSNTRNNQTGTETTSTTENATFRVWLKTDDEIATFKYYDGDVDLDSVKNDYTTFPVMMWEDGNRDQPNLIARSKYLPMVSVEKKRYNLQSQVDDSYFKNCFAFLAVNQDVQETIDLGNDGVFQYTGEGINKPEYVAPPVTHLDSMNQKNANLRTDLKENMNSTVVLDSRASGDARVASDKRRLEKLKQDTKDVQDAEMWLVNSMLRNYVDGSWTYQVTYIADFESLTKLDSLDTIDNVADSAGATMELKKELVIDKLRIVYANDEVRMNELILIQQNGTVESDAFDGAFEDEDVIDVED